MVVAVQVYTLTAVNVSGNGSGICPNFGAELCYGESCETCCEHKTVTWRGT